jgi:hypothetical protein
MKRRRRLRKLVPDAELIRRRAAEEPLRSLASDYGVVHTTLGRYFGRPEVAKQVREAVQQLRAERRVAAARRAAERRLDQAVRRKAREQSAREREQARKRSSRPRRVRSGYAGWLDERDARVPLTRADRHSQADEMAARVVAAGGGMQAVIEVTDLRTRANVDRLIDPVILTQALDNDLLSKQAPPPPV